MNRKISYEESFARSLREYVNLSTAEFDAIDTKSLSMTQAIAYNYVLESKTNTKTADKILEIIHNYETSFIEPVRLALG